MICVVTAYQTIRLWGARTLCEENTWLSFRNLTLSPEQLFQDPFKFIEMFGTNLKNSFLYIKYIYIQDQYQSNWPAVDPEFQVALSGSLVLGGKYINICNGNYLFCFFYTGYSAYSK